MKRWFAAVAMVLFSGAVFAAEPVAGKDYQELAIPVPVEGDKVQVVEIFYYGCPHCFHLESDVEAWAKTVPSWAVFTRVSGLFSDNWVPLTKLYYTLDAMGVAEKLTPKVFKAIHEEHVNLGDRKVLMDWIAKQGIDPKAFADAYDSFAVMSDVNRAKQQTADYQIEGVPSFVVDGKWRTSVSQTGSPANLFKVIDALMKKARSQREAAAKGGKK